MRVLRKERDGERNAGDGRERGAREHARAAVLRGAGGRRRGARAAARARRGARGGARLARRARARGGAGCGGGGARAGRARGGHGGERGEEVRGLVGHAVGRRGDGRGEGDRGDRAERLWGLGVGDGLAVGRVDTDEVLVVGVAHLEDVVLGLVGADVGDTDTVKTVVAVAAGVGVLGVADLEARQVGTNEAKRGLVK